MELLRVPGRTATTDRDCSCRELLMARLQDGRLAPATIVKVSSRLSTAPMLLAQSAVRIALHHPDRFKGPSPDESNRPLWELNSLDSRSESGGTFKWQV